MIVTLKRGEETFTVDTEISPNKADATIRAYQFNDWIAYNEDGVELPKPVIDKEAYNEKVKNDFTGFYGLSGYMR